MLDLREMKLHSTRLLWLLFLIVAVTAAPAAAQEMYTLENPPPVCPTAPVPVYAGATIISIAGSTILAKDNVWLIAGNRKLKASEASYNVDTDSGYFRHAVFTTCTAAKPDYRIEADEVRLLPYNRIALRHVSVYLGNTRVLVLPALKFHAGTGSANALLFPRPSYDPVDGMSIEDKMRLTDDSRSRTDADVRITQKHGVQGEFTSNYGLDGKIADFPGRSIIDNTFEEKDTSMPVGAGQTTCDTSDLAHLRVSGIVNMRSRTYDIRNSGLVVYRRPMLEMTYLANPLNVSGTRIDPRLQLIPELDTTWGMFREVPGQENYINRTTTDIAGGVNLLPLGKNTAVQPFYYENWSWYSTGNIYQQWCWGIDGAHLFNNGSEMGLRYIKRNQAGVTPFQFDQVEIFKELQYTFQVKHKKNQMAAFIANWDLGAGTLYEWEVVYGYTTDCIGAWVQLEQPDTAAVFQCGADSSLVKKVESK